VDCDAFSERAAQVRFTAVRLSHPARVLAPKLTRGMLLNRLV
jgi:hypothetical protein